MITLYTIVFVLLNFIVLIRGVSDGIEKTAKILMPLLFICLIGIVIRNLTLAGASEGIRFYLEPDFSKITTKLFIEVLGQVFFCTIIRIYSDAYPIIIFKQTRKSSQNCSYHRNLKYHNSNFSRSYDISFIIYS